MSTEDPPPSYDLTTQPWLPVQRADGSEALLSLQEVFEQAHSLRRLVGDVPTQEFALLRLLLAILHDAIEGPADVDEWAELWEEKHLPARQVTEYLHRHRDRFDLLHPRHPFFQVADLATAKAEVSSLDRIVADVPNGERFFTMRARGTARLGFAEAARWVVHAHAFDPSGIKSGAVGDPRVKGGRGYPLGVGWAGSLGGVLAEGADLRQTLLLNLIAADTDHLRFPPDDRPAWRREPTTAAPAADPASEVRPSGIRDLYTWQTRRLRLHFDGDGAYGLVLAYGDPLPARNMHDREPMTAWRRSPAQEKKLGLAQVYLPREHDPTRSAWRGLGSLVAGEVHGAAQRQEAAAVVRPRILDWVARLTVDGVLPQDYLIRARLLGAVYGTQQSVIDEIVDDAVAMPVVLLHERDSGLGRTAIDAVADAESAVTVLGDLATDLAEAAGAPADPPRNAARDSGFGALDGPFRSWLTTLAPGDDGAQRRGVWQREARRVVGGLADGLIDSAGEAAWQGRVITTATGAVWLSASRAETRFRRKLRQALPLTTVEPSSEAHP
ncbi:type I-E CRISPR-associated protein Cse1/CasA [Streptomyces sp. ACA25]|uniref:type I-E CRISPR-associated protein Cse1/CasA n=1 Tax=Streptomyces sp. ACA25 TaxID=3022596 RepID=UPI0023072991|nr:type I-E CRISPR-associated protein Cse1/CasA [Streptomyces sp. ACA25]MDB1087697.1 type I-E CRISPR-associated protein Cse1/CasA [Streptomyces sp. ACA25]